MIFTNIVDMFISKHSFFRQQEILHQKEQRAKSKVYFGKVDINRENIRYNDCYYTLTTWEWKIIESFI
jgi:hypothetical protein